MLNCLKSLKGLHFVSLFFIFVFHKQSALLVFALMLHYKKQLTMKKDLTVGNRKGSTWYGDIAKG